ncbi:MAG: hypothetical protein NTX53_16740 [candidate division WOR-3 bacterium]|nr:hypothetical protein [candidate division WOR-3 bacterium]
MGRDVNLGRRDGSGSPWLLVRVVVEPAEFAQDYPCRALPSLRNVGSALATRTLIGDCPSFPAIIALRQIGDERGMNAIATAVQDTDPDVEGAAEKALSGEGYQDQLNRAKRVARQLPYP